MISEGIGRFSEDTLLKIRNRKSFMENYDHYVIRIRDFVLIHQTLEKDNDACDLFFGLYEGHMASCIRKYYKDRDLNYDEELIREKRQILKAILFENFAEYDPYIANMSVWMAMKVESNLKKLYQSEKKKGIGTGSKCIHLTVDDEQLKGKESEEVDFSDILPGVERTNKREIILFYKLFVSLYRMMGYSPAEITKTFSNYTLSRLYNIIKKDYVVVSGEDITYVNSVFAIYEERLKRDMNSLLKGGATRTRRMMGKHLHVPAKDLHLKAFFGKHASKRIYAYHTTVSTRIALNKRKSA